MQPLFSMIAFMTIAFSSIAAPVNIAQFPLIGELLNDSSSSSGGDSDSGSGSGSGHGVLSSSSTTVLLELSTTPVALVTTAFPPSSSSTQETENYSSTAIQSSLMDSRTTQHTSTPPETSDKASLSTVLAVTSLATMMSSFPTSPVLSTALPAPTLISPMDPTNAHQAAFRRDLYLGLGIGLGALVVVVAALCVLIFGKRKSPSSPVRSIFDEHADETFRSAYALNSQERQQMTRMTTGNNSASSNKPVRADRLSVPILNSFYEPMTELYSVEV